ncbi:IS1 family transposase [Nitrosococcus watsonii]|uniref:IS1 family transposase n=1 Tax=Nitrosococcus watsonii TaxID=473531 RepID=UPI0012F8A849|nr:IS1 family transposase [Nitrosococcus watsonii]
MAFYIGDCSQDSAHQVWLRLPTSYRQQATFITDNNGEAYRGIIPTAQHQICPNGSGQTNAIERFNCTLPQRVSRLVRQTLLFSKKLANHIGAIKFFICHYNQEVIR